MRNLAVLAALLSLASRANAQQATTQTPEPQAPPSAAPPRGAPDAPPQGVTFVFSERSRIELSGRAWVAAESVRARGSTADPRENDVLNTLRMTNDSSYLRLRGEYDLAAKWMSWAQIEAQFAIDGHTSRGVPFDGIRNTGVGITTPYGSIQFGRWDSPFKQSTLRLDPWVGTGISGYYDVMGQTLAGDGSSDDRWNSRLSNSIMVSTPKLAGVQVKAATVFGERRLGTTHTYVASFSVTYDGPLYLATAYEIRGGCQPDDQTVACNGALLGTRGTDWGLRLGAGYTIARTFTRLGVAYEHLESNADQPSRLHLRKDTFFASVVQGLGTNRHQLVLAAGFSPDYGGSFLRDSRDTGARYLTAGYRFNWAKNLNLFAIYTRIDNRPNGVYRFGSRGFGVKPGADPEGISVGTQLMF